MGKAKKFNSTRFHELMNAKITQKGYKSVSKFVVANGYGRNAVARAMAGMTRPSVDNLNKWCKALECTPEERAEIISSVYIDDDEPVQYRSQVA
jgi:transcriptional regulator with XRE-family HTH domain